TRRSQLPKRLDTPADGGRFSLSHPMGEGRGEGDSAPKSEVVFALALSSSKSNPASVLNKDGERDRPGRSNRRLAYCFWRAAIIPNRSPCSRQIVFGQRRKTAGETPALPEAIAALRLSGGFI